VDVDNTIAELKSIKRHPKNIVWAEEDCWAVDALRGSLYELKWRRTLTQYFIDNPNHLSSMADRAIDRLWQLPEVKWDNTNSPLRDIRMGLGTFGWKYDPEVISKALSMDVALIDTAETYGYGRVETELGKVLEDDVWNPIVATKVSRSHLSYDSVINAARRSIDKLGAIDLYQIHWPNPKYPLDQSMSAMVTLRDHGAIGGIGVCNFSVDQLITAQSLAYPYGIQSIQVRYNLLDRGIERALMPYCWEIGLPIIAYSPLGQKFSRMLKADNNDLLTILASKYDATEAQIALAWMIGTADRIIPIPRTNNPDHAIEIMDAVEIELSADDVELLDDEFPVLE
jgi:diketogulonate reductase-like aldo/keto reductase